MRYAILLILRTCALAGVPQVCPSVPLAAVVFPLRARSQFNSWALLFATVSGAVHLPGNLPTILHLPAWRYMVHPYDMTDSHSYL